MMLRMTDYAPAIDPAITEQRSYKGSSVRSARIAEAALGRLLMVLGTAFILIAATTFLSLTLPSLAGLDAYIVASGSMEPGYPVNCVGYARETDPSEISTGDVIIFNDPSRGSTPITHRVVTNDTAAGLITTKGDANASIDANAVSYDNVIGKVVMHVPYLGYTANIFNGAIGRVFAAMILIASWLAIEVGRWLVSHKKYAIS